MPIAPSAKDRIDAPALRFRIEAVNELPKRARTNSQHAPPGAQSEIAGAALAQHDFGRDRSRSRSKISQSSSGGTMK